MGNYAFEDLTVGMASCRSYDFTEQRVESFAVLVDDHAPVHADAKFAERQGFAGRIVHGLFAQSIISGMLGEEVPGPKSVINNLSMKMHHPILIGQQVNYCVEIAALTASVSAVTLSFTGTVDGVVVLSGKALCSFPKEALK